MTPERGRPTITLPLAGLVVTALALSATLAGVRPGVAAEPVLHTASASATATEAALAGDGLVRRWTVDPGSGGLATDAGVATVSLLDPVTGMEHADGPSSDFALDVDGLSLTSTTGWSSVTTATGTVAADPGHGSGPFGGPLATVTFTFTRAIAKASIVLTRQYRLSPGDAMTEVRTSVSATGAPAMVTGWSVDQFGTRALTGPSTVVELHSGSSYTSRHEMTHTQTGTFDDEGEVAAVDDEPGAGVLLVDQRRAGPASRMTGTTLRGGLLVAAAVEPERELGIVPVENVSGTDTDNSLANPAYPAGPGPEVVAAGSSLELGTAYLGVFHGGDDSAPAVLQQHLAGSVLVGTPVDVEQNTFHPFNAGANMNETTMLAQATASQSLGARTFILDDGWEGGTTGLAGDWRLDPTKFPTLDANGNPAIIGRVNGLGMRFGLWMEALLFSPNSTAYKNNPTWACAPTGDASAQVPDSDGLGYWDATNTAWQAYMTGVVDRLVAQGVGEFKLDNEQWMTCGTSTYTQYERAWEALVRSWQARHPRVVFQLDETVDERSFPYQGLSIGPTWFEDDHVKSTSHPGATTLSQELSDLWQVAPWVPDSQIGLGLFHSTLSTTAPDGTAGYQLPFALLGGATFWTDTTSLSAADAAETRWWTGWYAAHHAAYSGLVYRDSTADPIDDVSPAFFQPWNQQTQSGYLTVVRQGDGISGPITVNVPVRDVDPTATYTLTDVRTGENLGSYPAATLTAGVPILMPAPFRARVVAVDKTAATPALPESPLAVGIPLMGLAVAALALRHGRGRSIQQ